MLEQFDDPDPLIDRRLTQAFSDSVRLRILELLSERVVMSLSQGLGVLRAEGATIDHVELAEHMEVLRDLKLVELMVSDDQKGFGYRLAIGAFMDDTVWHKIPNRLRPVLWSAALQAFTRASIAVLAAGTIERRESQFNLLPVSLDDEGWRKVVGAIAESLFLIEEAHQESIQRVQARESESELSTALVALTAFQTIPTQGAEGS